MSKPDERITASEPEGVGAEALRTAVLKVLERHPQGLSEYQLLRSLDLEVPGWLPAAADPDLALFQRHFVLMNLLYRIQAELVFAGWRLVIEPLCIQCLPLEAESRSAGLPTSGAEARLREYYLDDSELERIGGEEVRAMLADFWRRFRARESGDEALAALGLDAAADWPDVRQRYRQLAARHHPDRGGSSKAFAEIREAYEQLALVMAPAGEDRR